MFGSSLLRVLFRQKQETIYFFLRRGGCVHAKILTSSVFHGPNTSNYRLEIQSLSGGLIIPSGSTKPVYAIRGPNCGMEMSQIDNLDALAALSLPVTDQLMGHMDVCCSSYYLLNY